MAKRTPRQTARQIKIVMDWGELRSQKGMFSDAKYTDLGGEIIGNLQSWSKCTIWYLARLSNKMAVYINTKGFHFSFIAGV